jgi:hypothetical protein
MAKRNIGDEVIKGLEDALAFAQGKRVKTRVGQYACPSETGKQAAGSRSGARVSC